MFVFLTDPKTIFDEPSTPFASDKDRLNTVIYFLLTFLQYRGTKLEYIGYV